MAELPQRLTYPLFGPQNERVAHKFGKKYATKPQYQVYAGPFMVSAKGNTAKHWHMVPNPHYWDREHVYLQRINVTVYRNWQKTWDDYRNGRLDEVRLQSAANIKLYEKQAAYTARPYSRMVLISYRKQGSRSQVNQLIAQRNARLAISHAINRKRLSQKSYGATSLTAQGVVPAGLSRGQRGTADFAAAQPEQETLAYNPALAKREWQAALKRAHLKRITLTLGYLDAEYSGKIARALRQQLMRQLPGLTIKLKKRGWSYDQATPPAKTDLSLTT